MAKEEEMVSENQADDSRAEAGAEAHAGEDLLPLLEDARAKADEHWNQLLRVQADLENTRRRARQEVENAHKFGLEKFILELLPVKDSLEMGLAASSEGNETVDQFREGVELTLKMLESALEKFGVKTIDPLGETFDPEKHQAMSMQESDEYKPNTVMAVMQKGYQLNERLLRPAMVTVAKARSGEQESESVGQVDEQA